MLKSMGEGLVVEDRSPKVRIISLCDIWTQVLDSLKTKQRWLRREWYAWHND